MLYYNLVILFLVSLNFFAISKYILLYISTQKNVFISLKTKLKNVMVKVSFSSLELIKTISFSYACLVIIFAISENEM